MPTLSRAVGVAGALLIAASTVGATFASSHREAPLIATDPGADSTDLYAFVDPVDPTKVDIIANYIPMEDPAGGPNFFLFDPNVRYELNIDNTGDAKADITYRFTFRTSVANGGTFLYNANQVTSPSDPDLIVKQTYTLTRVGANGGEKTLASGLPVAPANVGARSNPDYATTAAAAVR
ncbi:MAG TPA: DUF4331 family protein, partial [Candidatus Limnocylindrales bacterium]